MGMFGLIRYFQWHLVSREIMKRLCVPYNKLMFRIAGVRFGKDMQIYNRFYLVKKLSATIMIGDHFRFTSEGGFNPLCRNMRGMIYADNNAEITIGNNSGASSACIWARERITIGNNVKIGGGTIIMDHDAHSLDYIERRDCRNEIASSRPIHIGDDVLIGVQCIVLKGVTIGSRSIIGGGSIVTSSIPEDCIAAGNPCKVIRFINKKL